MPLTRKLPFPGGCPKSPFIQRSLIQIAIWIRIAHSFEHQVGVLTFEDSLSNNSPIGEGWVRLTTSPSPQPF